LGQLATLDFRQLRADLVLRGIQGKIDDISRRLLAELFQETNVAGECRAERVAPLSEHLSEIQDCFFA
jgi:hypothetical protein